MDIQRALSYVFEDEEWITKLLLGSLLSLVPIFGTFAVSGYMIQVIRNVMQGSTRPLPEWNDLGEYFMDGLKYWVATLVYAIPVIILLVPMAIIWIVPALAANNEDLMGILFAGVSIVSVALYCLILLYAIVISLITPVVMIRYARTGEIGACLRVGEIVKLTLANIGPILISILLMWAASMVIGTVIGMLGTVLMFIPICGWILLIPASLLTIPVAVWTQAFTSHLYAQVGLKMTEEPLAAPA